MLLSRRFGAYCMACSWPEPGQHQGCQTAAADWNVQLQRKARHCAHHHQPAQEELTAAAAGPCTTGRRTATPSHSADVKQRLRLSLLQERGAAGSRGAGGEGPGAAATHPRKAVRIAWHLLEFIPCTVRPQVATSASFMSISIWATRQEIAAALLWAGVLSCGLVISLGSTNKY